MKRAKPDPTQPFAPPPRFRWPDGARCAVMLGFDVDGEKVDFDVIAT